MSSNWMKERLTCSTAKKFEEIVQAVREAVNKYNSHLRSEVRQHRVAIEGYSKLQPDRPLIIRLGIPYANADGIGPVPEWQHDIIWLALDEGEGRIRVMRGPQSAPLITGYVTVDWNPEAKCCDMNYGDRKVSMEELTYVLLHDFLFVDGPKI